MAPGQASSSHSMGNLLSVPRHSAGQVYHEQYVDNWDPQPGASIARVNSVSQQQRVPTANMPYRNYISVAAANPYQTYQPKVGRSNALLPGCPNSLVLPGAQPTSRVNGIDFAEVYQDVQYDSNPPQGHLGYWTNERRPVIPLIREPPSSESFLAIPSEPFLKIPSQYADRCPKNTSFAAAQVHNVPREHAAPPPHRYRQQHQQPASSSNYAAQYGYYTDDKTELVFPAVRNSHSQDFNSEVQPYFEEEGSEQQIENGQVDATTLDEQNEEEEEEEEDKSAEKNCSTEESNHAGTRDNSDSPSLETEATVVPTPKLHTVMPELNLDLSGLNSSDVSSDESNGEKCWKSPEEVRLGCGRVAALAKHFSQLGEAGLIKFKSRRFAGSRQFVSEPDIASPSSSDTKRRARASIEKFKSESELLKSDKSIATTPEKEWSMILLDIQARSTLECQHGPNAICCRKLPPELRRKHSKDSEDKSSSKLSLAEQEQIIEQLKEFSNLDNVDAPLFIPNNKEQKNGSRRDSGSERGAMTDSAEGSNENLRSCNSDRRKHPRTLISGSVRLEHFRNHSLPTILSTLNVYPEVRCNGSFSEAAPTATIKAKVNRLSKYWSLKDLASSDELDSNHTSTDDILDDRCDSPEAKYTVFPTCSRVVSAPEISDDCIGYPVLTNITIKSTISIGRGRSDESETASSTNSLHSSTRLSKSTSDITRDALDDQPGDEDDNDDDDDDDDDDDELNYKSKSCEKLAQNCHKRHARCYLKRNFGKGTNKIIIMRRKAKSEQDVSERKPTPRFEKDEWIFQEIPTIQQKQQQRMESRKMAMILSHKHWSSLV